MFDLGDPANLTNRELLHITHAFVSHTHVDHFIGFDALLRVFLGREKTLYLYGPPGFFSRVEGKLAGYTWNLVAEYAADLVLVVTELGTEARTTRRYSCRHRFQVQGMDEKTPAEGPVLWEPRFRVRAEILDHRIPCLAFALEERFHINIDKAALHALDLPVGPWLNDFKKALYRGEDPAGPFHVTWRSEGVETGRRTFALGELRDRIATISPGKKIAYVTDAAPNPMNFEKIEVLARGADHLFIEGAFLEEDRELARKKDHLTAAQAGALAARAGAGGFTLFHFSPRYLGREAELQKEALAAFARHLEDTD
jgi:ribonuclease Z